MAIQHKNNFWFTYEETKEILKATHMNYAKIFSQNDLIKNTREGNFIVGSFTDQGGFSFAPNAVAQTTAAAARAECKRLAAQNPGKNFVFVQLKGLEFVPASQSLSL